MYPFSLSIHLLIEKQFNLYGNTHRYSQRWVFQMILKPIKLIVKTIHHRCVFYKDFSLCCLFIKIVVSFVLQKLFHFMWYYRPVFRVLSYAVRVFTYILTYTHVSRDQTSRSACPHLQRHHSSLPVLYLAHSHSFLPSKGRDVPFQFVMGSLGTQLPKRGSHIDIGVS